LLNFLKETIQNTLTYTGIENLFPNRRVYLFAAACSTDALLLSQLHKLYKVFSGFMIGPQMGYKHEHLMSLTVFLSFIAAYSVFED
jgi:hypothetical protein